jgi:hypothetical protein
MLLNNMVKPHTVKIPQSTRLMVKSGVAASA